MAVSDISQLLDASKGDKKLRAYAYLTASFQESSSVKDTIDCLIPFVAAGVAEQSGKPLNLQKLSDFVHRVGLSIPVYVLQQLLPRLQKSGAIAWDEVRREHVCLDQARAIGAKLPQISEDLGQTFEAIEFRLNQFALRHGVAKVPVSSSWGDGLISFLKSETAGEVLRSTVIKGTLVGDGSQIETFIIARFIQECEFSSADLFDRIVSIFTGILIEDFLVNIQSIGTEQNFAKLNIYYDTTVLLRIMGTSGKLMQTATLEMHRTLQDLRAKTYYFDFTELEVINIIQTLLNNHAAGHEMFNETGDAIANGDITVGTIRDILSTFTVRLGQLNIFSFEYKYSTRTGEDKFQIDEAAFTRILEQEASKKGRSYKHESAVTDAKAMAIIMRLRRGSVVREVGKSGHVFVSHNVTLQRASRRFVQEFVDGYSPLSSPPIFTVGQITTTGWLSLSKNIEPSKASKELLSTCFNAVRPSNRWAEEFAKALREFQSENPEFANARADTLLFLQTARNTAAEESLGQPSILRKMNLTDLFSEAAKIAEETSLGKEREFQKLQDDAAKELNDAKREREEELRRVRSSASDEIEKIKRSAVEEAQIQTRHAIDIARENIEEVRRAKLFDKLASTADRLLSVAYSLSSLVAAFFLFMIACFVSFYLTDIHVINGSSQQFIIIPAGFIIVVTRGMILSGGSFIGRGYIIMKARQAKAIAEKIYSFLEGAASTGENYSAATNVGEESAREMSSENVSCIDNSKHVVLLVHGIRDHALWQHGIRDTLEARGFRVEPVNYGRFDLIRFLLPFDYFRNWAANEVEKQIRIVKEDNKDCKISIIAHSFGTHIVSNILKTAFDLRFCNIIFCGSVVQARFPFEQVRERFAFKILNEVGTADVWPAIAESVTLGYGAAGTFGFRRPLVTDRWHNGAAHSAFLTSEFCQKFWIPFLETGEIIPGAKNPAPPSALVRFFNVFKFRYLLATALIGAVLWLAYPKILALYTATNPTTIGSGGPKT